MAEGTFLDLGWDPRQWARNCDTVYEMQDRDTGHWCKFGSLMARSKAQQGFAKLVIKRLMRGGPQRIILLKGRKFGGSSLMATIIYDIATTCPGTYAGIMAHNQASSDILHRMYSTLWRRTDPNVRPQKTRKDNPIHFTAKYAAQVDAGEVGLDSIIECQTAGAHNPFTGGTMRLFHWSETGKTPGDYNKQTELATSVLNAMPTNGPSLAVFESTAQGVNNIFHDTWKNGMRNIEGGRDPHPGEWVPYFVGWQDDPLNQMQPAPDYDWADWFQKDFAHEAMLIKNYWGGDEEAAKPYLRWRRFKIAEIRGDFNKFNEDYPHSWQVAFLSSGQPAISREAFEYLEAHIKTPYTIYTTDLEDNDEALASKAVSGW